MPRKKKPQNKKTRVPSKDWVSKSSETTKYTRSLTFRMPHSIDQEWREAVRMSNSTQSEILNMLVEGFVRNRHRINKELDDRIEELMEMKEHNQSKVIAESVDDAIARLSRKGHLDLE